MKTQFAGKLEKIISVENLLEAWQELERGKKNSIKACNLIWGYCGIAGDIISKRKLGKLPCLRYNQNMTDIKKKRVGIFSLTCDEGCSIYLTEIFNQKLIPWLEKMELVYFLAIKDHVEIEDLDIALVEGVVTSERDVKLIEKIRANTKILIAMGTCAMTALPSGQRNNFNINQLKEIESHLEKYHFLPKALPLEEVVKVDDEISGCPIDEGKFIETFEKYI
jgi:coenzyme F420-reducing hydrogenase gamma subunit